MHSSDVKVRQKRVIRGTVISRQPARCSTRGAPHETRQRSQRTAAARRSYRSYRKTDLKCALPTAPCSVLRAPCSALLSSLELRRSAMDGFDNDDTPAAASPQALTPAKKKNPLAMMMTAARNTSVKAKASSPGPAAGTVEAKPGTLMTFTLRTGQNPLDAWFRGLSPEERAHIVHNMTRAGLTPGQAELEGDIDFEQIGFSASKKRPGGVFTVRFAEGVTVPVTWKSSFIGPQLKQAFAAAESASATEMDEMAKAQLGDLQAKHTAEIALLNAKYEAAVRASLDSGGDDVSAKIAALTTEMTAATVAINTRWAAVFARKRALDVSSVEAEPKKKKSKKAALPAKDQRRSDQAAKMSTGEQANQPPIAVMLLLNSVLGHLLTQTQTLGASGRELIQAVSLLREECPGEHTHVPCDT